MERRDEREKTRENRGERNEERGEIERERVLVPAGKACPTPLYALGAKSYPKMD